jgi:excinuclease ABC subunit C
MIDRDAIPAEPGVYLFKDTQGNVIYVGKARNLRDRVSSYFSASAKAPRTEHLVRRIASAEFFIVDNEIEALLLENNLIKQHAPKYNVALKDAKTFAYLHLSDEPYPKLCSVRRTGRKGEYFGPFVDGSARNELQQLAIRLFKLRVCRTLPKRACLNYHLGLCTAPCIGNVTKEQYAGQAEQARSFLRGNTQDTERRLEREMRDAAARKEYEAALERRRQLEAIAHARERQKVDRLETRDQDVVALKTAGPWTYVEMFTIRKGVLSGKREFKIERQERLLEQFLLRYYDTRPIPNEIIVSEQCWDDEQGKRALEEYFAKRRGGKVAITLPRAGEKRGLVDLARKNLRVAADVLEELQRQLTLPQLPTVIECFDISHLGGTHTVGGMTRWVDGYPDPAGYRRFLVRTVEGQSDDYASLREIVRRRYEKLLAEGAQLPGLVLIDGGAGQLGAALDALRAVGMQLPVVALAKRREELYVPGEALPRQHDQNGAMMLFLRRVRDSTHRQAITYNRKRRAMGLREQAA